MAEHVHMIHGDPVICTTLGEPFNFLNPDPATIHLDDIAESLAKDCRYTGKTPGVFYSVAEHSVLCSYCVPDDWKLQALMHDAAEAYTGDFTSPYKKLLATVTDLPKRVDDRITRAIFKKFGIPICGSGLGEILHEHVHDADGYVYVQERHQLCHDDAEEWWDHHGDPDPEFPKINCYEWRDAKQLFIDRFNELFYGLSGRKAAS